MCRSSPRCSTPMRACRTKPYAASSKVSSTASPISPSSSRRAPSRRPRKEKGRPMSSRPVKRVVQSKPTIEGAGVHLRRAFGFGETSETDPFLLFDDFRNDRPDDYLTGFPWHPHRGIETNTNTKTNTKTHNNTHNKHNTQRAGDVQWMTAGRGIMH